MALTPKQKSFLKGQAHHLKPVVMLGKEGLSEGVVHAVYHALRSHELIKIKVGSNDQKEFRKMARAIMSHCDGVETVQSIGHNLVLYRPSTPAGKISKALQEAKIPYTKSQKELALAESLKDDENTSSHDEEE